MRPWPTRAPLGVPSSLRARGPSGVQRERGERLCRAVLRVEPTPGRAPDPEHRMWARAGLHSGCTQSPARWRAEIRGSEHHNRQREDLRRDRGHRRLGALYLPLRLRSPAGGRVCGREARGRRALPLRPHPPDGGDRVITYPALSRIQVRVEGVSDGEATEASCSTEATTFLRPGPLEPPFGKQRPRDA